MRGSDVGGQPSVGSSYLYTHNCDIFTHWLMRTNIDIDDQLMRKAMRSSGARTKKATVEAGLRLLVETHAQRSITRFRGKVQWQGDLDQSRLGRVRTQA